MIEDLLPGSFATVSTREDLCDVELFAEEEQIVSRAVETRRREFSTARACGHQALRQLGIAPVPIPTGEHGEPLWPHGVVGSITHCRGYRACAVARAADVVTVGVDAEVDEPLPAGVLEHIAFGRELALVAHRNAGVHLDKLLFSAKETVYKAWFPLARSWLGFEDVEVSIDLEAAAFRARLLVPGPVLDGVRLTEFRGRWAVAGGIVAAATVVLREPGPGASRPRRVSPRHA